MLLQKEKDILDRKLSQMNEEMNEYQSRAVYDKLSRSTRLNYFKYLLCCKFNNPLNSLMNFTGRQDLFLAVNIFKKITAIRFEKSK